MSKEVKFWGQEDDERLTHTSMDVAIESIIDDSPISDLPETIEVCGYAYRVPNVTKIADYVIEHLLEHLDEEFGDHDGGYTDSTDSIKEAAEELVTTTLEEFTVWACDLVTRKTLNVKDWIKENRPEWLKENDK